MEIDDVVNQLAEIDVKVKSIDKQLKNLEMILREIESNTRK